jgi:cell division transport system permease protein
MFRIAPAAKRAMALGRGHIFRVMVVMTALLGWLVGMAASSLTGLELLFQNWQLEQQSKLSIYLLADSPEADVQKLIETLLQEEGVTTVNRMTSTELVDMLSVQLGDATALPLPVVLDVTVDPSVAPEHLTETVHALFPSAEIDDARTVLSTVARGVRTAQVIGLMLLGLMSLIMALLVTLSVQAGLHAISRSMQILQYIGATNGFMTKLVTSQILERALVGWVGAAVLTSVSILIAWLLWPSITPNTLLWLWGAGVGAPLLLPLVAGLTAWLTALRVVKG